MCIAGLSAPRRPPETPADLARHACLIYDETGTPHNWRFEAPDRRAVTVRVTGPLTASNPEFVHRLALAGHGVVLGPNFSFCTDIAAGHLVPLLTDWRSRELSINALYPHRSLLSAKVRRFIDFLAERLGTDPEWERPTERRKSPGGTVTPRRERDAMK